MFIIGIGVVTGAISARLLMPGGRGQLSAIQLWPSLLAVIATFGMPESIAFFTAKHRNQARQYLATALTASIIFSVPLIVVAYMTLPSILSSKGASVFLDARVYLIFIPIYALSFLSAQAIRGIQRNLFWNLLRILPNFAWFLVLVFFVSLHLTNHVPVTPTMVANAYLAALSVVAVVTALIAVKALDGKFVPDISLCRPLFKYGLPVLGATLPVTLNLRLDQLVMTAITPARELGLYTVAVAWGGIVSPMLNSLGSIVLPRFASLPNESDQRTLLLRVSRTAILIASITGVIGLALTPLGIKLIFGHAYNGSINSAYILVIASSCLGVSFILTESLLGIRYTRGPLRAQIIGFVAMAVSLAFLLPRYGIFGAAVSSLIGYAVNTVSLLFEAKLKTESTMKDLCIPKTSDVVSLIATTHGLMLRLFGRDK
jgi:O-antigen/teichoic acid export membrane protein